MVPSRKLHAPGGTLPQPPAGWFETAPPPRESGAWTSVEETSPSRNDDARMRRLAGRRDGLQSARGTRRANVVPDPGDEDTVMEPPCATAISRAM